jgi:hypothetical protein
MERSSTKDPEQKNCAVVKRPVVAVLVKPGQSSIRKKKRLRMQRLLNCGGHVRILRAEGPRAYVQMK